jgi:glycine/D-amino acid oxidase-like deaminating enzyme
VGTSAGGAVLARCALCLARSHDGTRISTVSAREIAGGNSGGKRQS